mmetsp:Transcript_3283/g.10973  ORF Transcript_3283/g.10973 Transcript_3283/m.10973 type:complete len:376 (-) Transcript_3283:134-1261(-)
MPFSRASLALVTPASRIELSSSSVSTSIALRTPASPPHARPHATGLPIATTSAPSANAFSTSDPLRTPPSNTTGTTFSVAVCVTLVALPLRPSLTPATTSASARNVDGAPSSCRPPWFDTHTPSTPCATANAASSRVITPLRMIGSAGTIDLSHGMSEDHVRLASRSPTRFAMRFCAALASDDEGRSDDSDESESESFPPPWSTFASFSPSRILNPFLTSLSLRPSVGASTVTTIAVAPASAARLASAAVAALSRLTYSWNHIRAPPPSPIPPPSHARAILSTLVVACCAAQYGTPRDAHARTAARSPSGCAMLCIATGATRSGVRSFLPRPMAGADVDVSTSRTSTRTRGHSVTSANADAFARSVDSVSAPPAK